MSLYEVAKLFQFYDSTIKRPCRIAYHSGRTSFQFYDSTIKSLIIFALTRSTQCFNSTIVRLKDRPDRVRSATPEFQFYDSTIKRKTDIKNLMEIQMFQFYDSTIKRLPSAHV